MKRRYGWIIIALLMLFAAVGCVRRPLEDLYRNSIKVVIKCVWEVRAYPEGLKPDGVTMYFFKDGKYFNSITTPNVDSCEVQLPAGHYKMFMISQSPEEYWKMEFDNMTSYQEAEATLRETASAAWASRADGSVVVENPEVMCAGVSDEFDITTEMTEDYQYYYTNLRSIRSRSSKGTKSDISEEEKMYEEMVEYRTVRIPVYPQNIVSQFWVTIYAGNADVLKSVRASTSGMARSWELTQGVTGSNKAIQIINQWTLDMDDASRRVGHVDGIITTFGLPNGEQPSAMRDSTLNVSALLIDNSTVADYTFSVGDKIQVLPPNSGYHGLYRLVFGSVENPMIVLPDVKPVQGGGGFTVGVEDWDDEIEADIVL